MRIVHGDDGTVRFDISPDEWAKLGTDATMLLEWFGSALDALVALRTGAELDATTWHRIINDLEHRLADRLDGIRAATIRAHHAAGGTVGGLAIAMDVERSTAQYRRDKVVKNAPDAWEAWAIAGGPRHPLT